MATISKFYLLDAASPNTGTMPSNSPAAIQGGAVDGDATGAATARDATDVHGSSNPDVKSTVTATANQVFQRWGHRRFVSRPLAAHTFASADGNWTWSCAYSESNLAHNQSLGLTVYGWRPSSGARVGSGSQWARLSQVEPTAAGTEEAHSATISWATSLTIADGDILVFDVWTEFTQTMSSAYTESFDYDGTTEASTTTCASFVTPPAALTLFGGGNTYTKAGFAKEGV